MNLKEPELQGLTEAEFESLPWEWMVLGLVYVIAGLLVFWMIRRDVKVGKP